MLKSTRSSIRDYRDLDAWQLAMAIVVSIYRITRAFPTEEKFGLVAQVRRAAVSIRSTIAEGHDRLGPTECRRFVSMARGSVAEVETQLTISVALGFVAVNEISSLSLELTRLSKRLFGLYRSLSDS